MPIDHAAQTVLITGASSGIGRGFARELAARGSGVVLVARRADRLDELAQELHARHGTLATTIATDLSEPDGATRLHDELVRRDVAVTSLINSAGFGTWGRFTEEAPDRISQEIELDVSAPVRLSAAFLPQILAAGHGYLIHVASMAAYVPTPRMAVYGASKAFVLSFSEALWAELRGTGVTVFALSPGATRTEFNDVVGTENATAGARMRRPEDVVATALTHMERRNPGPSVIDGAVNRWAAALGRVPSRRTNVALMNRMTDPDRRRTRAAGAH